ncbi:MAG TPA: hypothetical protein VMD99_09905 [Terriglobales bacterium]|nr:hypothetical protein [Terriglobales bacterium]
MVCSRKVSKRTGRKFEPVISATVLAMVFAMVWAAAFPPARAAAQAVTLQDQLVAQYKAVKMGSDTSGYSVVDKGSVLEIKKGGIIGVPYSDKTILTTKYEQGTVHGPSTAMTEARKRIFGHFSQTQSEGQTTHLFAAGDKVYSQKVEVDTAKDEVTMFIVACDTCNKTDPPTYNKAKVIFVFPKGSLVKAQAGEVEDTIGQLLAMSDDQSGGGGDQQGGNGGDQQQGGQDQGQQQAGGGGQDQQAQQPAQPQTIEKGMSPDQVTGVLGNPDKIVNLGAKQLYIYKDMKVTFLNGKVSDVE